jgi:hypothetical protein
MTYRDSFPNARLTRSKSDVLEIATNEIFGRTMD